MKGPPPTAMVSSSPPFTVLPFALKIINDIDEDDKVAETSILPHGEEMQRLHLTFVSLIAILISSLSFTSLIDIPFTLDRSLSLIITHINQQSAYYLIVNLLRHRTNKYVNHDHSQWS